MPPKKKKVAKSAGKKAAVTKPEVETAAAATAAAADAPPTILFNRLVEVLELKGHPTRPLTDLGGRTGLATSAVAFREFSDPYFVDLSELEEDAPLDRDRWQEFAARHQRSGIGRGVLVTNHGFTKEVSAAAAKAGNVALYTFDEMLADLIDFNPYLNEVVTHWESDPLHSGEIVIPAEASMKKGGDRLHLDPFVDQWLEEPGRDPLFFLGRYGSGKTTYVKRLAARLARAYQEDPVHNLMPILVPLREYSSLSEMDELIVSRIAELAPDQAPPSRRAFRVLLEAGRFLLILDGLDELIRRLETNYVLKNFDKVCSLILPGTKAIVTAREGYLGTPEDEAQILGRSRSRDEAGTPRFERLFLEPVDREGIRWYISQRYPERAEHYQMVVETRPDFLELATTPLLLELMLRSLPLIEGRLYVNPAVVMTAFLHSWAELGKHKRTILTTAEDAIAFTTELAWQMHWGGVYKVHFTELSPRIKSRFREQLLTNDAPDPFRNDLAECPFLSLDRDGNYAFVQNSFLDYLSALAYMRYLVEHGTAPVDNRRTNPDMQRFLRDLATMDERYLEAYHALLAELREREDPTQWLFYRGLLPVVEKQKIFAAEAERASREALAAAPPIGAPEGMLFVPGGQFVFGSYEHRDESPVRRVQVAPFYIDHHPVTHAQYHEFIAATGHHRPLWDEEHTFAWVDGEPLASAADLPITLINYADAEAYAEWAGKRLPTEHEWELAARGFEGRRYPWGDEFDPELCNGAAGAQGGLTPVGDRPEARSVFGCEDMSGNAWEWTASRYDKLPALRILKGGSHLSNEDELRCANRMYWAPESAKPDISFRCVVSAEAAGEVATAAMRRRSSADEHESDDYAAEDEDEP